MGIQPGRAIQHSGMLVKAYNQHAKNETKQKINKTKSLIRSICQFPWCKYSSTTNAEIPTRHYQLQSRKETAPLALVRLTSQLHPITALYHHLPESSSSFCYFSDDGKGVRESDRNYLPYKNAISTL